MAPQLASTLSLAISLHVYDRRVHYHIVTTSPKRHDLVLFLLIAICFCVDGVLIEKKVYFCVNGT